MALEDVRLTVCLWSNWSNVSREPWTQSGAHCSVCRQHSVTAACLAFESLSHVWTHLLNSRTRKFCAHNKAHHRVLLNKLKSISRTDAAAAGNWL